MAVLQRLRYYLRVSCLKVWLPKSTVCLEICQKGERTTPGNILDLDEKLVLETAHAKCVGNIALVWKQVGTGAKHPQSSEAEQQHVTVLSLTFPFCFQVKCLTTSWLMAEWRRRRPGPSLDRSAAPRARRQLSLSFTLTSLQFLK